MFNSPVLRWFHLTVYFLSGNVTAYETAARRGCWATSRLRIVIFGIKSVAVKAVTATTVSTPLHTPTSTSYRFSVIPRNAWKLQKTLSLICKTLFRPSPQDSGIVLKRRRDVTFNTSGVVRYHWQYKKQVPTLANSKRGEGLICVIQSYRDKIIKLATHPCYQAPNVASDITNCNFDIPAPKIDSAMPSQCARAKWCCNCACALWPQFPHN